MLPPELPVKARSLSRDQVLAAVVPTRPNRLPAAEPTSSTPVTSTSSVSATTLAKLSSSTSTSRKIERHQSSDSILSTPASSASTLVPATKRRHSSQERLGRFSVKTSSAKLNGTCQPTAPLPLPPRPKISASEKPKLRYSRSTSGPILTGSGPRRDSDQIVIEQVCLVNNNNNNIIKGTKVSVDRRPSNDSSTNKVPVPAKFRSRTLLRASSYNSGSSNSSVSSQATEEISLTDSSSSTDSSAFGKRTHSHRTPVLITHPRITADLPRRVYTGSSSVGNVGNGVGGVNDFTDGVVSQWKERKREEKRLAERRAFLQSQMRRLS